MNDKSQKVSENRQKKEVIVAEVSEKIGKAKAMVFTNYQGLTHKQLEEFKKEIRKSDAEFAATKNTLLKRALGDEAIAGNEDKFQQPTGTVYMYGDVAAPLKVLAKMIKDFEKPTIKFGILDGKAITEADVKKLASLPSREVLIAQMLGMMNAPIQGFHRALSWNLQKFVMTLSAVAKKKGTETPAVAEKPAEAVKEEIAAEPAQTEEPKAETIEAAPAAQSEEPKTEEQPAEENQA